MTEPCPYCLADVRVTRWDNVMDMAVRCPHCGAHFGPHWTPRRLLVLAFASLFVNALVLFFVARPGRALLLICVYAASIFALFTMAQSTNSEVLFGTAMLCTIVGPACIAAIEYVQHELALARNLRPRIVVVDTLEQFRNEVEIAIFHQKDQIALATKCSYAVAALLAVTVALEGAWILFSISLLMIALAHTIEAHESRPFAIAYTLFGLTVAGWTLATGNQSLGISLPILITGLGVLFTVRCFRLARLRRLRSTIPLGPAEHLRD